MARVERIRRHYEARVTPERATYDILDWGSRESQLRRFDVLKRVISQYNLASGFRLLDVGCGMTDLAEYMERSGTNVTYVGVDITYALLAEVKRRTPSRRVLQADVFSAAPFADQAMDVSYCSGVFNLRLGNNDAFARQALPQLARLSRTVAVVNFLHRRTVHQYPHCHYFDPDRVADAMEREGLEVSIIDDYLDNDFTVVLSRNPPPREKDH